MITLERIDEINSTLSTREAKASHVLCFDGAEARALISLARWAFEARDVLYSYSIHAGNCDAIVDRLNRLDIYKDRECDCSARRANEALSTFPSKDGEAM